MSQNDVKKTSAVFIWASFLAAFLAVFCICLFVGSVDIPFKDILRILTGRTVPADAGDMSASYTIIKNVRLPRVILCALVGASLSVAGAAMQSFLKNPLADGSVLGVSSGASLGAVLSIAFPIVPLIKLGISTAVSGIVFALLSLVLVIVIARGIGV